jgi:hypothetical protein
MSQLYAPFGLRPAFAPTGILRPGPLGSIESGYNTTIYQYSPVLIDADGFLEVAAAGADAVGTFMGVEYVDVEGRFRVSNRWVAGTVATEIRAYYTLQQAEIMYEIQADETLTRASIGEQFDWTTLSGNSITGLSSVGLDVSTTAANAGLRVLGLNPGPDNDWGDPFPIVLVQISQHPFVADVAAI